MTAALIARLRELLGKCSPMPWAIDPDDRPGMRWNNQIVQAGNRNMAIAFMSHDNTPTNAECIANAYLIAESVNALPVLLEAHNALPALLDALDAAEKSSDELAKQLHELQVRYDNLWDEAKAAIAAREREK